jgi:hypothetical protein
MASHTLSTDEEGIVAALKMAGYRVRYDINACRWQMWKPPITGITISDENKHRFFKDCAEWIAKHH